MMSAVVQLKLVMVGAVLLTVMVALSEAGPLKGSIKKRIFCNFNGCGNKRSSRDFTSADIALDDDSDTLRQDGGMNLPYDSLISSQSDLQNPFLRQQMAERLQEAADNYRNEAEPASAWNALNLRRLARLSAMRAMGEAPRRINKRSAADFALDQQILANMV